MDENTQAERSELDQAWNLVQSGLQKEQEGQTIIDDGQKTVERGHRIIQEGYARITLGQTLKAKGREEWIKGTLALMQILSEARVRFWENDVGFGQWLKDNGYGENHLSVDDRKGLIQMSKDPKLAKRILEQTTQRSWQNIWHKEYLPIARFKKAEAERAKQAETNETSVNQDGSGVCQDAEISKEEIMGEELRFDRRPDLGPIPYDIRKQFEDATRIIRIQLQKLAELTFYADQMSPQLRHVLANEMLGIKIAAEKLARGMKGGDQDLRKIYRAYCHEYVPLTAKEAQQIEEFEQAMQNGGFYCKSCCNTHCNWSQGDHTPTPETGVIVECGECGHATSLKHHPQ